MMLRRVVITGATSMLGISLMNYLLSQGVEKILAICSPGSTRIKNIPKHSCIQIIQGDLAYLEDIKQVIRSEYEIFYHFAWIGTQAKTRNNIKVQMKNIGYTLDALRLAKELGCKTFVGAGSQAEYGIWEKPLSEETPTCPQDAYGFAKYMAGRLSQFYAKEIGMQHMWVRVVSIYGPHDRKDTMIMSTLKQLLATGQAAFTKGEQIWDYLYEDDAARAMALIGSRGKPGSIYVLGSGKAYSLKQYIEEMIEVLGKGHTAKFGEIPYKADAKMYLCADITKLTEDTGFLPQIAFKEGISETVKALCKEEYHE